ncbi:unannotated protein [freshwater metagenome]|uniref:Unannotated protein n=1 Tax=freshwater metagenome TaxID=449393 RepID=A0A6J7K6G0_9ZZZZ
MARQAASQSIVHDETFDEDRTIAEMDAVTLDEVREVARAIDPAVASVACVGPHEAGDFDWDAS